MSNKNRLLQEDNKTRKELLENIEIKKTTYGDAEEIIRILKSVFKISSDKEVLHQLLYSSANLDESVKVIDKRDGKIYGLLIFSEYPISVGSPIIHINRLLNDYLSNYKLINGFAFVIDSRLSGTRVDKKMLRYNNDFIGKYDFVWCAVDNKLETQHYWERLGFQELFNIDEAKFYIKNISRKDMLDVFILKTLKPHEKNIY